MIKHKLFLRWWLAFASILVGLTVFTTGGGWTELYSKDATKLSFAIIAVFLGMSQWCGYKTWLLSRFIDRGKRIEDDHMIKQVENTMEAGWFASDLCLTVGMAGTVIGFIMMLSGFAKVDVSDVSTVQGLIKNLGMSTALYSTLAGLICSALLKLQYFNLNQAVDRIRRHET